MARSTLPRGAALLVSVLVIVAIPATRARAQAPAVIIGRVIDDLQRPAVSAEILIPDLNLTVRVGPDGRYRLEVPGARVRGQTVLVTARKIGLRPSTLSFQLNAGEDTLDFSLERDVQQLHALVVTGVMAGTEQVKVPFSITRIDTSMMRVPAANPLSQIQGKVPGANIVSASGRPGSAPSLLLRGPKSLNAQGRSQEPLYILDGAIVRGGLPDINPLDIESVEVVKGAAASSLYGAQAGNGVIQIRTKSGRGALDGVSFHTRTEMGVSDIERNFGIAKRHALMTDETGLRFCQSISGQPACSRTFDYLETQWAINNAPGATVPSAPSLPVDPGASIAGSVLRQRFQVDQWPHPTYDAVAVAVQPHVFQQHVIDMTAKFGNTSVFASGSTLSQPGAIRFLDGYRRETLRMNVDQQISEHWQAGLRAYYAHASSDGFDQEGGGRSFFRLTRSPAVVNPLARDTLGRLFIRPNLQTGGLQNENPLYWLENQERIDVDERLLGGVDVKYTPLPWLDANANVNFDIASGRGEQFRDKGFRDNFNSPTLQNGLIFNYADATNAINTSLSVSTRHRRGELSIKPSLRYFYEHERTELRTLQGEFLAVQGVRSASNASLNQAINSNSTETRQISVAGGAMLDYKDRYILDGILRRDGTSRFGAANRWDTYGRMSGTWRIGAEPWWTYEPVSEFRLRGSYGTAGIVPNFAAQFETFTVGAGGIVSFGTLGNRNLRPEKVTEFEFGGDLELLGRYLLAATWSRATVDDQILPVPVPASTGFGTQWKNAGTLENTTYELALDLPIMRRENFSWTTRFSYDHTRSMITKLLVPPFNMGVGGQNAGSVFRLEPGTRFGTFYGRRFLRSCSELPEDFRSQCGPNGAFQRNDDGFVVWVGDGNSWRDGITSNLWQAQLAAGTAPYGFALNWGMPIIMRDSAGGPASVRPLGNALPDFRFAVAQDVQWKRLTVYALLDASIGQDVWNQGLHWAHLDFLSKNVDQNGKTVETAKPIGYYYRAGFPDAGGIGGLYDLLAPNNFSVEDASYAKLRELMVSYRLGPIGGVGDWNVSLVGRNLLTFTRYRGFDPEVGLTGGQANTAALNAIDAFTFPNTRSFTIGLSTKL